MKNTNSSDIGKILLWIIVGILVLIAVSLYLDQLNAVHGRDDISRTIALHK